CARQDCVPRPEATKLAVHRPQCPLRNRTCRQEPGPSGIGLMSRKSGMELERPAAPVLVIEDNTEVRQALVALLEAEGYGVVEAVDGVSALRLLRAGEVRPCLIVLDLMMPRMSGWDFRMEQSSDRRLAAI